VPCGAATSSVDPVCVLCITIGICYVYTLCRMDSRPVVWDKSNRRHLIEDHPERGITQSEVEEALADPQRIETAEIRTGVAYHTVIGATAHGRPLIVVWVDRPAGRFPVHARPAGRRSARRYYS